MGVVVFLIFPGAGELNRGFTAEEIIHEEFVKEFLPVVTVESEDGKGQGFFNIFDFVCNVPESFAVGGALLRPVGGNVERIGGDRIMAFGSRTAVSYGIGFQEARARFLPLMGLDGNMVFEKKARFSRTPAIASVKVTDGFEGLING